MSKKNTTSADEKPSGEAPNIPATTEEQTSPSVEIKPSGTVTTIDDQPETLPATAAVTNNEITEIPGYDAELSGKKVKIEIAEQSGEGGRDAVFVQVNGVAYQIPRNKICSIPVEVFSVIQDAKYTTYEQRGQETIPHEVKRFAYSFHGEV